MNLQGSGCRTFDYGKDCFRHGASDLHPENASVFGLAFQVEIYLPILSRVARINIIDQPLLVLSSLIGPCYDRRPVRCTAPRDIQHLRVVFDTDDHKGIAVGLWLEEPKLRARICRGRYFIIDDDGTVGLVILKVPSGSSVRDPINWRKDDRFKRETLLLRVFPGVGDDRIAVVRYVLVCEDIDDAIIGCTL